MELFLRASQKHYRHVLLWFYNWFAEYGAAGNGFEQGFISKVIIYWQCSHKKLSKTIFMNSSILS